MREFNKNPYILIEDLKPIVERVVTNEAERSELMTEVAGAIKERHESFNQFKTPRHLRQYLLERAHAMSAFRKLNRELAAMYARFNQEKETELLRYRDARVELLNEHQAIMRDLNSNAEELQIAIQRCAPESEEKKALETNRNEIHKSIKRRRSAFNTEFERLVAEHVRLRKEISYNKQQAIEALISRRTATRAALDMVISLIKNAKDEELPGIAAEMGIDIPTDEKGGEE